MPRNHDYNGPSQEGISYSQVMMRDGVRSSAASAYLAPVRSRANLQVLTQSLVRRIVIEDGRAAGVEFERGSEVQTVRARREVLLCGGTIASPQLLMLSGIGDARTLAALGIPVVADRPAVGRNLQEHVRVQLVYRTRIPSLNQEARGLRLVGHVARYAWRKQGLLASTASQVNGFVRSSTGRGSSGPAARVPSLVRRLSRGTASSSTITRASWRWSVCCGREVAATSTLRTADPHVSPSIVVGHLTDPADYEPLIRGVKLMRSIFATAPLANAWKRK